MRISLFETEFDGHRPLYLSELVTTFRDAGHEVQLMLPPEFRETPQYQEYLADQEEDFTYFPIRRSPFARSFFSDLVRLRVLAASLYKHETDHLVIPYGNGIILWMVVIPSWIPGLQRPRHLSWDTLLLRTHSVYRGNSFKQRLAGLLERFVLKRTSARKVHFLDQHACETIAEQIGSRANWIPELLPPWEILGREAALQRLADQRWISQSQLERLRASVIIGSPGVITLRKGTDTLIEAFVRMRDRPEMSLLLSSPMLDEVRQRLKERQVDWMNDPRIVLVDRFLDEDSFRSLSQAIDIVCLPYRNHRAVSAVFLRSLLLQQRTIVDGRAWLGWAAERYQHGNVLDTSNPLELEQHLRASMERDRWRIATPETVSHVFAENTPERFREAWLAGLKPPSATASTAT